MSGGLLLNFSKNPKYTDLEKLDFYFNAIQISWLFDTKQRKWEVLLEISLHSHNLISCPWTLWGRASFLESRMPENKIIITRTKLLTAHRYWLISYIFTSALESWLGPYIRNSDDSASSSLPLPTFFVVVADFGVILCWHHDNDWWSPSRQDSRAQRVRWWKPRLEPEEQNLQSPT